MYVPVWKNLKTLSGCAGYKSVQPLGNLLL